MMSILCLYLTGVIASLFCGVALLWYTAEKGTRSYDYKIAKVMIRYALIFPYGCVKIIDLLEEEKYDDNKNS